MSKKLRSHSIFQHKENTQIPEYLNGKEEKQYLLDLIVEMDRRLIQLWDKVSYERQNKEG